MLVFLCSVNEGIPSEYNAYGSPKGWSYWFLGGCWSHTWVLCKSGSSLNSACLNLLLISCPRQCGDGEDSSSGLSSTGAASSFILILLLSS